MITFSMNVFVLRLCLGSQALGRLKEGERKRRLSASRRHRRLPHRRWLPPRPRQWAGDESSTPSAIPDLSTPFRGHNRQVKPLRHDRGRRLPWPILASVRVRRTAARASSPSRRSELDLHRSYAFHAHKPRSREPVCGSQETGTWLYRNCKVQRYGCLATLNVTLIYYIGKRRAKEREHTLVVL